MTYRRTNNTASGRATESADACAFLTRGERCGTARPRYDRDDHRKQDELTL